MSEARKHMQRRAFRRDPEPIVRIDISEDGEPTQSVQVIPDADGRHVTIILGDTTGASFEYRHRNGSLDHLLASAMAKAWWGRSDPDIETTEEF